MADRIALLHKGELLACLPPDELFAREDLVETAGLSLPVAVSVAKKLEERGIKLDKMPCRKSELSKLIAGKWRELC